MENKVNLADKLGLLDGPFQPGIVGTMNDYKLVVVKVHGEFVWRKHDDTGEEAHVLLIEPEGTVNTGDAGAADLGWGEWLGLRA